jgi:poly-gamma-glutamate synthesis protein (capsule biosynthesis protein)
MFADIGPLIAGADYAICHLETPFAPPGVQLSTMPKYQVPTEVALALADAGYDRCSTASNHTMDGGVASIDHTVSALLEAGISQAGMARTLEEIEPTVVNVNGLAVSHLSYTIHFNGLSLPADEPWRSARVDIERILDDATTARNMGAELVIVSMHWGNEGSSRPNPNQKDWSEKLAASGLIDIVVGSHPHVLQPIEQVGDMWVLNSLGNFISAMPTGDKWPPSTQDGAVVLVEVSGVPGGRFHVGRPEVVPTWVDRDHGFVVRDVRRWLLDHPDDREVSESLRRTLAVMGDFMESP